MAKLLLEGKFLHQLESLKLLSKVAKKVHFAGERRGAKPGSGLEFIDYQEYQSGDDYRYIDWHLFSRLEQLFIKLFIEEETLRVFLIVDRSASMSSGEPSKLDYARRLAASLGYIAVANLDEVGGAAFSSHLQKALPPRRGKPQVFRLFEFLQRLNPRGRTNFNLSLREFSREQKHPGMAIVLSDLLDTGGYEEGLLTLRSRGWEVSLIQILEDGELEPPEKGEVVLVDKETGQRVETIVDEVILNRYEQEVRNFLQGIESFCKHYQIKYIRTTTSLSLSELIFKQLRKVRILK